MKLNKIIKKIIICSFLLFSFVILIYPVGGVFFLFEIWTPDLCDKGIIERVFYDNKKVFRKLEITAQTAIRSSYKHELDSVFKHKLIKEPLQLRARIDHYGGFKLFPYRKTIIDIQSFSVYPKSFMIEITMCGGIGVQGWYEGYVWISDQVDDRYDGSHIYLKYDIGDSSDIRIKKISGNWFLYKETKNVFHIE
jgi:hypothetical protein